MKKSELKKLVAEYKETKLKFQKSNNYKLKEKIAEIEHRYYHETGRILKIESKEFR